MQGSFRPPPLDIQHGCPTEAQPGRPSVLGTSIVIFGTAPRRLVKNHGFFLAAERRSNRGVGAVIARDFVAEATEIFVDFAGACQSGGDMGQDVLRADMLDEVRLL